MLRERKSSVDLAGLQKTRRGPRWLKAVLVVGAAFLSFDLFAAEKRARVLVDSFAEENYLKSKETGEGLVPETYHLVQGKKISFKANIVQVLIKHKSHLLDSVRLNNKARKFFEKRAVKPRDEV